MSKDTARPGRKEKHHHGKKSGQFTALLLKWASERRPKPPKSRKEMTEDELKTWKTERNRKRRMKRQAAKKAEAVERGLGNKKPTPNTCRRRRLAAKHPERKWEQQ